MKAGHKPGPETSIFKYYGTELNMRRREAHGVDCRAAGTGLGGAGFDESELTLTRDWLRSRGNSIEGGTSEIQLNIIAKRVLGLRTETRAERRRHGPRTDGRADTVAGNRTRVREQELVAASHSRPARQSRPARYSRDLWTEMAQLGWLGIPFPEEHGGVGLGYTELMVVLEEFGRGLMPEPLLSTVLLGGSALALAGTAEQAASHPARTDRREPADHARVSGTAQPLQSHPRRDTRPACEWRLDPERGEGSSARPVWSRPCDSLSADCGGAGDAHGITLFVLDGKAPGVRSSASGASTAATRDTSTSIRLPSVRACPRRGGRRGRSPRRRSGPGDGRTVRRDARQHAGGVRDDPGLLEDARPVWGADRIVSSAEAPCRQRCSSKSNSRARSSSAAHKALDDGVRTWRSWSARRRRGARMPSCSSATRWLQMHGGIGMTDEHDAGFFPQASSCWRT